MNEQELDAIGKELLPNTTFNCVQARLLTYRKWSAYHIVRPQTLAEDGFIFDHDCIRCVFCLGEVHNWLHVDTALEEHRRHYPQCPYVTACNMQNKKNGCHWMSSVRNYYPAQR